MRKVVLSQVQSLTAALGGKLGVGVGRPWGGFSQGLSGVSQSSGHCTWAGVTPAASPRSLPVHSHGHSALGQSSGAGLGDKRLLPLLQGSARSELLISTTHQHSCCSLQITYRILSIRLPKDKGPYVSWPDKSCGKLEEGGEITLNIA